MFENLEVFITTYNRAETLKETLLSICNQSAQGFVINILDNASTDNTKDVVEDLKTQFPSREINFIGLSENIGGTKNIQLAMNLAQKKWVMIFHDDDLMHPDYIKNAMYLLEKTPDSVMASCTYIPYEFPTAEDWGDFSKDAYIVDVKGFASLMFGYIMHNFASAIYKTELLKKIKLNEEKYGKMCDRPFMIEIAKQGKTVVLKEPYIRYRIHAGQDSNNALTGPFIHEYFTLMNNYKDVLGNNWFDKYGAIYNALIFSNLRLGYHWLSSVNSIMKFKEFKKKAYEAGVIRKFETPRIIENFYKIIHSIFMKSGYKN